MQTDGESKQFKSWLDNPRRTAKFIQTDDEGKQFKSWLDSPRHTAKLIQTDDEGKQFKSWLQGTPTNQATNNQTKSSPSYKG